MRRLGIIGLGLIVLAGLAGLGLQRRETLALRAHLAEQQRLAAEAERLAAEHQRLASAQVPADEMVRRQEDRAVLTAMANELESIRRRTKPAAAVIPARPANARPWLRREEVAVEAWANRGSADPDSAFETAL